MGRRANKKSKKKIKLTDKHTPMSMRELCGENMLPSETYKSADRFMEKTRANERFGRMFMPDIIEHGAEMEQAIVADDGIEMELEFISNISDWHTPSESIEGVGDSIEDIREAMRDMINDNLRFADVVILEVKRTGFCAVCGMMLNYDYPEDYPDEWKFCCYCQPRAIKLIDGRLKPTTRYLKKIYDKITLVKGDVG